MGWKIQAIWYGWSVRWEGTYAEGEMAKGQTGTGAPSCGAFSSVLRKLCVSLRQWVLTEGQTRNYEIRFGR
jgi:hypothetical protein